MKRILSLCLVVLIAVSSKAQFLNFPHFGQNLKISAQPELGLESLSVGDEGYVRFQVTNTSDSTYTGPLYLRVFEREGSLQVLACKKIKIKPGKEYSVTTVFSTSLLNPYARYFIGFEFNEDGHTVPMEYLEQQQLSSFMLLPPIINNPVKKSPLKAKVKEVKKSKKTEKK